MEEFKWPEITADTPIEEVKRIHQQIWDYVIEHGWKPDDAYKKYFLVVPHASMQKQLLKSIIL